ncbi:hypothetical protein VYU27_004037 [Nannochloropsis oceanica]
MAPLEASSSPSQEHQPALDKHEAWPDPEEEGKDGNYRGYTMDVTASAVEEMQVGEENVQWAYRLIQLLDADTRLFLADGLLRKVEAFVATGTGPLSQWARRVMVIPENAKRLAELRRRVEVCRQAARDMRSDDWHLAHTEDGIETFSRKDEGDNTLAWRTHGEIEDCPVVSQLAVLREPDHYHRWIPLMDKSKVVKRLGKIEQMVWFRVAGTGIPFVRDAVLHLYGCDASEENLIILSGASMPESEITDEMDVRPPKKKWNHARVDIKYFSIQLKILSPTHCKIDLIYNLDVKLTLVPQAIINYFSKFTCGWVIWFLFQEMRRIQTDPVHNPTAQLMRSDPFYANYLVPYCLHLAHTKGWAVPDVPAFEVDRDCTTAKAWRQEHHELLAKNRLLSGGGGEGGSGGEERGGGGQEGK